jgi:hypothetical protein
MGLGQPTEQEQHCDDDVAIEEAQDDCYKLADEEGVYDPQDKAKGLFRNHVVAHVSL